MSNKERIEEIERQVMGISAIEAKYTSTIIKKLNEIKKLLKQFIEAAGEEKN